MTNAVTRARNLKIEAMDLRDKHDFRGALEILQQAREGLDAALARLTRSEGAGRPGQSEQEVIEQLGHILGSCGGVYRRQACYGQFANADDRRRCFEESVKAYDEGYRFEKQACQYGTANSYNLTQRLVARVFLEPGCVSDGADPVLGLSVQAELLAARKEIQDQIKGPRPKDEYAAADRAFVSLLLGDTAWKTDVDKFKKWEFEPGPQGSKSRDYAFTVTRDVLADLHKRVSESASAPPGLGDRLKWAVEQLKE
jgi:hypothetical protein